MPELLASLLFLPPLTAALLIAAGMLTGCLRDETAEPVAGRLSTLAALLSLFAALGLAGYRLLSPTSVASATVRFDWFTSGGLELALAVATDAMALGIGSLFALLLYLVQRFSVNYLHREPGFFRYFMVLDLFSAAILLIVFSGNALTAFVGWELAGLSSYLLIAYARERPVATANATRVFVTSRLGDAGFLLALVLAYFWAGSTDWSRMPAALADLDDARHFFVLSGFVLAALVKSALFPFCSWLTRALEGPTPSSAVFYGALMVHAGIFLLLRISPLVDASPAMQMILVALGVLTVLYGWLGGLVQSDVKSALIFSTLTQVGLMLTGIGLGWYVPVAVFLAAHAAWRAYQMLSAPSYLTLVSRPARPVAGWMRNRPLLFNAALQRLWLDNFIDWIAVRPTALFARDLNHFDERIVNRMVGLPGQIDAISSLTDYEERRRGLVNPEAALTRGHGVLGALMEKIASILHWFEESLVLKGSGDGLLRLLEKVGSYLMRIDYLFSRPRYLWLIIMLTVLVVL